MEANKTQWRDCGYISLTKSGKATLIVVKHKRYTANIEQIGMVLEGIRDYAFIYEPIENAKGGKDVGRFSF
jgi:hypothetical protein